MRKILLHSIVLKAAFIVTFYALHLTVSFASYEPVARLSGPVGKWSTMNDGDYLWCSNDGSYAGHVTKNSGGWYESWIEGKNQGSFVSSTTAKAHIERKAKCD